MKPVVSSLVALALAIAPLSAYAAKPAVHGKTAHVSKKAEDKKEDKSVADKSDKSEKSDKAEAIVRVKAGKKDGASSKPALHHAHNVNLDGAGHKEPGHKEDGALVAASMVTKTPAASHGKAMKKAESKDLPKLPDPKAGKPSKGGAEKGAHKAPKKTEKAESSSSDDGETSRDEDTAELVARIAGHKNADEHDKGVSRVLHEEPASSSSPKSDAAKDAKKHAADDDAVVAKEEGTAPSKANEATQGTKHAHGSAKPCSKEPIEIVRGPEVERFALTQCDGSLAPLAVEHLSVLIRPGGTARPTASYAELAKKPGQDLAHGIRRVDPRLVERIQALAEHFGKPGAPAKLFVISGYRPASVGSMHSTGRAIDFRVEGVKNEDVVAFCKSIGDTGCGYYPNSSFVHVDVRDQGAGHVSWIDASGPGETPRYVASWPEPSMPEGSHAKRGLERTSIVTLDPLAEEGEKVLKAKRPAEGVTGEETATEQ